MLAAALHLAIVLPLTWTLNLWLDEAWTMRTTARGVLNALSEAVWQERQAPVYFAVLAVWRVFNDSLFWARCFSILCTIASIFVFDKLAKRFVSPGKQNLFVFFFAVHPFLIYAALEARVYALAVLLAALLLLVWHDGYLIENRRKQTIYVLLAWFAVYTNYYLGFNLVAGAAGLIVLRRWGALKSYLLQMCAVAVLILPLVLIIKSQFAANSEYYRAAPDLLDGAKHIWNHINDFVLPTPEQNVFAVLRLWIVRAGFLLVIVGGVYKFLNRRDAETQRGTKKFGDFDNTISNSASLRLCGSSRKKTRALAVFAATIAAFLLAAYFLIGADYVQLRHAAPFFPVVFLLLATVLSEILSGRNLILVSILLAVFYSAALSETYSPLAKRGDWARVSKFIEQNETENQPIIIFRVYDALPFRFYYTGKNRIVPPDALHGWNAEDADESAKRWQKQIEFVIKQIPPEHEKLWLVTEDRCDAPETAVECRPLEDFVIENYVTERTENFYKRKVRLLKRKVK